MTPEIKVQIRQSIETKYRQALDALNIVEAYLNDVPALAVASRNGFHPLPPAERVPNLRTSKLPVGSYRERVLAEITAKLASVDQISEATGLERKRIRGVLNARDLKPRIIKTEDGDGSTLYKLKHSEPAEKQK